MDETQSRGTPPEGPELSVEGLLELLTGYQAPATVVAAAQLGIFDALEHAATPGEVAARVDADTGAVGAAMHALAALGVLEQRPGGRFANSPISSRLGRDGDLRLVLEKEAFFAEAWLGLAETLRTAEPRVRPWRERLATEPERAREFLAALVVLAHTTGPDLAALCGVGPSTRVVDLGGGLGSHAVPLARAVAEVVLVDLPEVIPWSIEAIGSADEHVRGRIRTVAADLFDAEARAALGSGYDLTVVSHLLHDLDDDAARHALELARSLTGPGGSVAVVEIPGDSTPPVGALFDLMMRVETPGRARPVAELVELMGSVGLLGVAPAPGAPEPHVVLVGTAP